MTLAYCCKKMDLFQAWSPEYINFKQNPPIAKLVNQKHKNWSNWVYFDYCPFCGSNISRNDC